MQQHPQQHPGHSRQSNPGQQPAMIISHQPLEGPYYPSHHMQQPMSQQIPPRLANPSGYHHSQQHMHHTIDPSLLSFSTPPVKQEGDPMNDPLNDPFGSLVNEYEFANTLDGAADPAAIMSPMSNSPLDDPDFGMQRASTFSPHVSAHSLSTSLQSTPYGTPGMQIPAHTHGNFYSMSMPVHATNGFGAMDHSKMMGSQPSSFSAYGHGAEIIDEAGLKHLDALTEKRRKRRESHNAVERRRRDNINEKIQELATLLPDFATDAQNKPNKGVILRRSVDYVRQLQQFASAQVDRNRELEEVLRRVLERTGINEADLGLSMPLGIVVELPTVPPPGPGEQHVDHAVSEQAEYGMEDQQG
ncbi:Transcription factor E3 [Gaertneriomyces sp. JEL0708]|nr:Transcription factor E3 [Gaertneriomyces sp. JEL0708]